MPTTLRRVREQGKGVGVAEHQKFSGTSRCPLQRCGLPGLAASTEAVALRTHGVGAEFGCMKLVGDEGKVTGPVTVKIGHYYRLWHFFDIKLLLRETYVEL